MVPQNILNVIFKIFLRKLLFRKMVIHSIGNVIMVLPIKFCIFKTKTINLQ